MTYTDHAETERSVNVGFCTFAFPELHVPHPAKERFAALFNNPHINTAGCRWREERQTLMPFTANMIFTTEQHAQKHRG